MTIILMSQWAHILEDTIIPSFFQFHTDLMDLLATHANSLKRLRISFPESTAQKPFSALSIDVSAFPSLPALEILDLTHWGPSIPDLTSLLASGRPVPNLKHLIIDHGTEIPPTDFDDDDDDDDDDDEEVGPDYDYDNPPPKVETQSWPALGAHLAARRPALHSLSAALNDMRYAWWPVGRRLRQDRLQTFLRDGAGDTARGLDDLVVCTAWPVEYEAREPGGGTGSEDEDLYAHAPGCGHLAYPANQAPTAGLWPAFTPEALGTQTLAGRPWY
jgi:hypothetical protein